MDSDLELHLNEGIDGVHPLDDHIHSNRENRNDSHQDNEENDGGLKGNRISNSYFFNDPFQNNVSFNEQYSFVDHHHPLDDHHHHDHHNHHHEDNHVHHEENHEHHVDKNHSIDSFGMDNNHSLHQHNHNIQSILHHDSDIIQHHNINNIHSIGENHHSIHSIDPLRMYHNHDHHPDPVDYHLDEDGMSTMQFIHPIQPSHFNLPPIHEPTRFNLNNNSSGVNVGMGPPLGSAARTLPQNRSIRMRENILNPLLRENSGSSVHKESTPKKVLSVEMKRTTPRQSTVRTKRTRWKPSQEELKNLEELWSRTSYPTTKEKEAVKQRLGAVSTISLKQITSWFKHRRESKGIFEEKLLPNPTFSAEETNELTKEFNLNPYLKGNEIDLIANRLNIDPKRVRNWFKHKRTKLAKQGKFEYKQRKLLLPSQSIFLKGAFHTNPTPVQAMCESMGNELRVPKAQVARWFSNQRSKKKLKEHPNSHSSNLGDNDLNEEMDEEISEGSMGEEDDVDGYHYTAEYGEEEEEELDNSEHTIALPDNLLISRTDIAYRSTPKNSVQFQNNLFAPLRPQ